MLETNCARRGHGDGDTACKEITESAEPDLQFLLHSLLVANQPCKEAVQTASEDDVTRERLSKSEIEVTEESGDSATVEVLNPEDSPVPLKVEVIRQGDDWRINDQNIGSANP